MILDPTIEVDGIALWERGQLHPERFAATARILDADPALAAAFRTPAGPVGVEPAQAPAASAPAASSPADPATASPFQTSQGA